MKKYLATILLFITLPGMTYAQSGSKIDSLRHELSIATHDSTRAHFMNRLSNYYRANRPDSAIFYANEALILARNINAPELEVQALALSTLVQIYIGNDSRALQLNLEAIKIAELIALKNPGLFVQSGRIYEMSGNYSKALEESRKAKTMADSINHNFFMVLARARMAEMFLFMDQLDSAIYYGHMAEDYAEKNSGAGYFSKHALGQIYFKKGDMERALKFLREALQSSQVNFLIYNSLYKMAKVYQEIGEADSSAYYANKSLNTSMEGQLYKYIMEANILLSEIYEGSEPEKALQYSKSAFAYRDTLDNFTKNATLEAFFDFDEQERISEIEKATASYENKVQRLWIFSIAGALLSALFVAFILFRNNKNKQKANALLHEQKEEIQSTLEQLRSTQSQLIQSEKMASLGELTAGIAHEIQNPLNFVNNFSEVSGELVGELEDELNMNNPDVARQIAADLKQNLDKISHHGERASGIVQGMLQHSRKGDQSKEPTDINVLAEEYLRLAYHGLRAKDKFFNAEFNADLDANLPNINVISQDIGRVFLNLINNAFYAVSKKYKRDLNGYKPNVVISTKSTDNSVTIKIKDNGDGMPKEIKDKIFQPFFTTKPAGEGTGLGLSLSYDIITKGHGGQLQVETEEGQGTEFKITLPYN